jgi:hypothetical protein
MLRVNGLIHLVLEVYDVRYEVIRDHLTPMHVLQEVLSVLQLSLLSVEFYHVYTRHEEQDLLLEFKEVYV